MSDLINDNTSGFYNEVTLKDENGKDVVFDHIMTFKYEGDRYVALMPVDEVEGIGEDEVLILRIISQNGQDNYETIDNEIMLNEVFDEFMRLLEESEDDDDDDDDEDIE